MLNRFIAPVACLALFVGISTANTSALAGAAAPLATVSESFTTFGEGFFSEIEYTITHNGAEQDPTISAFAVDFGFPELLIETNFFGEVSPFVEREGWTASLTTSSAWDEGVSCGAECSTNGLSFDDLDSALDFFGSDDADIVLFVNSTGDNIGPEDGPIDGFGVLNGLARSNFVAICGSSVCATGPVVTAPEPATLALFGAGLIGVGATVRRRRKAA